MNDRQPPVTAEPQDAAPEFVAPESLATESAAPESLWTRIRARRHDEGPRPVALWSLAYPTVVSLAAVFGIGRTETHEPGGLPATLMLWIAGPALFVSLRQKVRNAGRALGIGAGVGLASCLLFTAVFGSESVGVDFAGIVLGVFVFDVAYWLASKQP